MNDDAIREAAVHTLDAHPQTGCGCCTTYEGIKCPEHGVDYLSVEAADAECWHEPPDRLDLLADAVIDAVRPLIEAQLRARLAAAIEAEGAGRGNAGLYRVGLRDAARIVRERP